MTAATFQAFIKTVAERFVRNRHILLIFDNTPANQSACKNILTRNFSIFFFPLYLHAIPEYSQSSWKAAMKRHMMENDDMILQHSHEMRITTLVHICEQSVVAVRQEGMQNAYLYK